MDRKEEHTWSVPATWQGPLAPYLILKVHHDIQLTFLELSFLSFMKSRCY